MPDILSTVILTFGGTTLLLGALFTFLGKIQINRILTQEKASLSKELAKELAKDQVKYAKKQAKSQSKFLKKIERIKNSLTQETESHKIKLKKSEFIFEKQFEAANKLHKLMLNIIPPALWQDMDMSDVADYIGSNFTDVSNLTNKYLADNSVVLNNEVKEKLNGIIYLSDHHKFEEFHPEMPLTNEQVDAAQEVYYKITEANDVMTKYIHSQVAI